MSLNYREIDLILEELDLNGSRIVKINQPDRFSLFLETYSTGNRQFILISLAHGAVRIHRIEKRPTFPDFPPRFSQLLRSRIKGGFIQNVSQPHGERLVQFTISCHSEIFFIWIRLWGGNPNIILTDHNSKIIDVFYRKAKANEVSGKFFIPDFSLLARKNNKERFIREYDNNLDFNKQVETEYLDKKIVIDFEIRKLKECSLLSAKLVKFQRSIDSLLKRKDLYNTWETYKIKGEILQSNLFQIKKGDQFFSGQDFYHDDEPILIELKQDLTPFENSELYFKNFKRFKHGLHLIDTEINSINTSMDSIKSDLKNLSQCTSFDELSELLPAQVKALKNRVKNQIGLIFHSSGFELLVGRNSKENDQLLRRMVKGKDIWLHVRDNPGGYVFIKSHKGKSVPLDILLDGANLALLYSKKKIKDKSDILYTEVKNLRRVKGGKEGLVLAQNEKNIFIKYDEARIKRLQNKSILETIPFNPDN